MSDGLRDELAAALAGFFHTDVGPLDCRAADALLPVVRRYAAQQLRAAADHLAFTPLSQRESGEISDYTAGMHAAGKVVLLRADAIEAGE